MWIKEIETKKYEYSHDELIFLFNHEKFYIMDNHLAATWCWLRRINVNNSYNLFHIDRHYDLLLSPDTVKSEIIDKVIEFDKLTLKDYLNLKQPMSGNRFAKMFRHDNYIGNLSLIYPKLFKKCYFATHKDGNRIPKLISYEPEIIELDTNISYWINNHNTHKWIVNIDLDYFFTDNCNYDVYRFLSDEYILEICKQLSDCMESIEVITIAISPTFCGGLDKAKKVLKIFTDYFHFDLKLNI